MCYFGFAYGVNNKYLWYNVSIWEIDKMCNVSVIKYGSIFYVMVLEYIYKRQYQKNVLPSITMKYYLNFTKHQELILVAPSNSENNKNAHVGVRTRVQII